MAVDAVRVTLCVESEGRCSSAEVSREILSLRMAILGSETSKGGGDKAGVAVVAVEGTGAEGAAGGTIPAT